jgi:hypothetical protein
MIHEVYIIGLGEMKVSIKPDGRFWYAEGVEWDYGAQGNTIADAAFNFIVGFQRTVILNMEKFGKFDASKWKRGITVKVPDFIVQRLLV